MQTVCKFRFRFCIVKFVFSATTQLPADFPWHLRRPLLFLKKKSMALVISLHPHLISAIRTPSCNSKDNTQSSDISSDVDSVLLVLHATSCSPASFVSVRGCLKRCIVLHLCKAAYSDKVCKKFGIVSLQKCQVARQCRRLFVLNYFFA